MERLSVACRMVAEEQFRPNLCCGVFRKPLFLSKIIHNGVSAVVFTMSALSQISSRGILTSNNDNQTRPLTCYTYDDPVDK